MNKLLIGLAVLVAVLIGGFYWLNGYIYQQKQGPTDYKNATYIIAGQPVTLVNGEAESEIAPGSASKLITKYFGNEAAGDLNGDGIPDLAFLLTQEGGGSGTFFYLVGAIQTEAGTYNGTHAVLIGDRIAPQTTEYRNFSGIPGGYIIVNYAERAAGEPMTAQPSIGKSLYLKLDAQTMQFGEIVQDFEGEADPSRMTLGMTTWAWQQTKTAGNTVVPKKADAFTLKFADGQVSIHTDCNLGGGTYTADATGNISFGPIAATLMYCEGSQEGDFYNMVNDVSSYRFTSKGELILGLKSGGEMTLR